MKLSRTVSKLQSDTISIRKITKGNISAKNVGAVTIVISACHRGDQIR